MVVKQWCKTREIKYLNKLCYFKQPTTAKILPKILQSTQTFICLLGDVFYLWDTYAEKEKNPILLEEILYDI